MICCPQIVASKSYLSQTAALSSTVVYTPSSTGVFLASVVLNNQTGDTFATLTVTDEFSVSKDYSTTTTPDNGIVVTFVAKGGTDIKIKTQIDMTTNYDLYVTVMQIQ